MNDTNDLPLLNEEEFNEENTSLIDILESSGCYVEAFWLNSEEVVSPDGTVILTDEEAAYDEDMDYESNLERIALMVMEKAESFAYDIDTNHNQHCLVRSDGCATKWASGKRHTYMDGMVGLPKNGTEGARVVTAVEFARMNAVRQRNVLYREG